MREETQAGVLTFLFTDLEGSTRLWEDSPEAMQPAMARHDALLRQAIEDHHGSIVKTTGDGVHAAFASPTDALAAALAAQRALSDEHWPEAVGPLKVRMGLHSGESQAREGDFFGPELNRAARIMSVSHGGQILLSQATAALVQDALPPDVSLRDLGEHHLSDLARPEHLYQLCHPDLVLDFPPLKSLTNLKHNLPVQLTSFIGREKELKQVEQTIAPQALQGRPAWGESRLLTLLGPGGTGKTRLALQAAAELVDQFPDGAWLVELAPLADPDLIPDRVAAALNVQQRPGRPILDTLTAHLQRKELLLLLDNVEHLVRECAELAEHLLTHCPSIKMLVTGREALFIEGEITLQIPSLSLPGRGQQSLDAVASSEAVQLFLARAQAVRPGFAVTPDNADALAEVVRRLDGIPLALELAAARLRMMSVEQIAAHLNDRFRLLTGGRRTALPRQQTLQALIDWSWNLLDEREQVLLRRLSVFSGGWTLEAAQVVAGDEQLDEFDILDLLDQLINKSLVSVEYLSEDNVRYSMLESIRQYARDRLFEAGEGQSLRDRHAEYFTAFGKRMSELFEGPDMLVWLERFLRETDNAKSAREWAIESRLDLALSMTAVSMLVRRYWFFTAEGRRWVSQVVEQARARLAVDNDPTYQRGLASALVTLGGTTFARGESEEAVPFLEEGIAVAREAREIESLCYGLSLLVIILAQFGELDRAAAVGDEALTLTRQHGLGTLQMMVLGSFTPAFVFRGSHEQALAYTEEAIRLAKQRGNPWMRAMAAFQRGQLEQHEGNLTKAEAYFMEAAELFAAVRDEPFFQISTSEAGHVKRLLGDYAGAEQIYRQTILFFQEAEGRSAVIHQLECFGIVAAFEDQHLRAATLLGASQALREQEQSARRPNEQAEFDEALAYLAGVMGQEELEAAMVEGRRMSVDEAVDFALAEPLT